MLGVAVAEIARAAGRLRPRLRLRPKQDIVKVNVGAGLCTAPGWLHVEGSLYALFAKAPAPILSLLHRGSNTAQLQLSRADYIRTLRTHQYIFYNLDRGLPFADNVVDYVYSSHVLEHFYQRDAERLIADMHRVLKPGGVVRVCVPDLAHAVGLYQEGQKQAALDFFFVPERRSTFAAHYYMYDFELLSALLRRHGFVEITRRQCGEGWTPDLDKLDNRPEQTLYVEARKPPQPT